MRHIYLTKSEKLQKISKDSINLRKQNRKRLISTPINVKESIKVENSEKQNHSLSMEFTPRLTLNPTRNTTPVKTESHNLFQILSSEGNLEMKLKADTAF
jgi:hypothetical protein